MINYLRIRVLALILFSFTSAFAQRNGEVLGQLLTAEVEDPLSFATVTVYTAVDTQMINYELTEDDGSFRIRRLPLNTELRVIISFLGYEPIRKNFTLSGSESIKDFGKIKMDTTTQTLEEDLVQARRPPITMNKDTTECNASSFTTRHDATVEYMIQILPVV